MTAATVSLTIDPVNDAPVIVGDAAGDMLEDASATIDVLSLASDVDGDALSVSAVTDGTNGTVTINPDGTVTYTPTTDATGNSVYNDLAVGETATDTFTYTVSDGLGGTVTDTATVTITGTNDAPVITGSAAGDMLEDAAGVTIDVLSNASDVDASDTLSVASITTGPTAR